MEKQLKYQASINFIKSSFVFCSYFFCFSFFCFFYFINSLEIHADSLWETSQQQFYNVSSRRIVVGDIITIKITESTSAVQEASTRTSKESGFGTNFLTNWDQVASLLGNESIPCHSFKKTARSLSTGR